MDLSEISTILSPDINELELEMTSILGSDHPFLQELNNRIMAAPGKRLRPMLLILCSKMLEYTGDQIPIYASVFELVHTATLIHDDIIDGSKTRRGQTTLNHELGNTLTVLFGDLIYTKAHSAAIRAGRLDILGTITWVSENMIEGELLQNKYNFDMDIDEASYFDVLKRKTAYLFGGTVKVAGMISNRSPEDCRALFDFGFNLGISFQLMDDYLDYAGSEAEMGKPVLSDLKDGKLTLPIIKLRRKEEESSRKLIQDYWDGKPGASQALLQLLGTHSFLEETQALARNFAEQARKQLEGFPNNLYTMALKELPFFLLNRKK